MISIRTYLSSTNSVLPRWSLLVDMCDEDKWSDWTSSSQPPPALPGTCGTVTRTRNNDPCLIERKIKILVSPSFYCKSPCLILPTPHTHMGGLITSILYLNPNQHCDLKIHLSQLRKTLVVTSAWHRGVLCKHTSIKMGIEN